MNALPPEFTEWFATKGWDIHPHQQDMLDRADAPALLLIAPTGGGKTMAGFLPTLVDLADHTGYSRGHISRHLNSIPEVKEALERARLEAADAMAEQTIKLADDLARRHDDGGRGLTEPFHPSHGTR